MHCSVVDGKLTIGRTSTAIYNHGNQAKVPDVVFYDTDQVESLGICRNPVLTSFHSNIAFESVGSVASGFLAGRSLAPSRQSRSGQEPTD